MDPAKLPRKGAWITLILSPLAVPTGDPFTILIIAGLAAPLTYFALKILTRRSPAAVWTNWKALGIIAGTAILSLTLVLLLVWPRDV
jgi:hypothetical protein